MVAIARKQPKIIVIKKVDGRIKWDYNVQEAK